MNDFDTIVIGGGQSGLACGYFLQRTGLNYVILDDQAHSGGAWNHVWDSLTLFSPAEYSSLPGRMMPRSNNPYPIKQEVLDYLYSYEANYKLNIQRSVKVVSVKRFDNGFELETDKGVYTAKSLISATGTWHQPFTPEIIGRDQYKGRQVHSALYSNPKSFVGQRVLIVGGGNSGAQLLSELSNVTQTSWATLQEPTYLPDDVDGRVLFNVATAKYNALKEGREFKVSDYNLGNIVMVPSVRKARERGVLKSRGNLYSLKQRGVVWSDGKEELFDFIIWCTGFKYATRHLEGVVNLDEKGKSATDGTQSVEVPGLWFVGYGNWTGFASATLIGVGRSARQTVEQIKEYLQLHQ